MSGWKTTVFVFLSVAALACQAAAQATLGTIRGVVADESQGALPGATVTVTNLRTGMSRTVLTDEAGRYAVLSLPAAPYAIRAALTGFAPTLLKQVRLEVAQTLDIDIELKVSGLEENVVVTADAPVIERDSAELGGRLDAKRLVELPINGRDFTRFSLLVPGAVAIKPAIIAITFNGLHFTHNSYTIDGIDASAVLAPQIANGYETGARLLTGSLDSIQEFRVHTANFPAEYGRAASAVVNIVTKSGGNDVHGTAFEFLRNSALDARNFFVPPGERKPLYILNQFGGNVSGPIVKNKSFFFINYEGSRQNLNITQAGTVPSQALRQAVLANAPALAPILATMPVGTTPRSEWVDNYIAVRPLSVREDTGSVKVDHRLSESDSLFARVNLNDTRVFGTWLGPQLPRSGWFATDQGQDVPARTTNLALQEQHTFSARAVNEFKLGLQRSVIQQIQTSPFPRTVVTGLTIQAGSINPRAADFATSYQAIDNLAFSRGPHAFKTGLEIRRIHINSHSADAVSMTYDSLDEFARNHVATADLTRGNPGRGLRQMQYGIYFQDDVKVRRNLTLNLGLRYEYFSVFREVKNRVRAFNVLTGNLDPPGRPWYRPDRNNFAPRVGFAWSPASDSRLVVRGGFGLYYQALHAYSMTFLGNSANIFTNTLPGTLTLLGNQIPNLAYPLDPFLQYGTGVTPSVTGFAPDRRDVYTEQWTLSVQHEMNPNTVMQAAYVGNRGINLYRYTNINLYDPALGRRPNPQFANVLLYQNTAQSVYHSLQLSVRRRFSHGLALDANYVYGHAIDDVDDQGPLGLPPGPQDANNLRAERGNSVRDVRHNASFHAIYDLPVGPGHIFLSQATGVMGQLLGGWQVNALGIFRTGSPFNVELGGLSPSGNRNTVNQRPDRVVGVPTHAADRAIDHWLNPAAFAIPRPGTFGNLGRNTEYGPGFAQIDVSLLKTTRIRETTSLQFRAEFFNIVNHPNFNIPSNRLRDSATFGRVLSTFGNRIGFGTPRQIQFGLKLIF